MYYFDCHEPDLDIEDQEGTQHADLASAHAAAIAGIRCMLAEQVRAGSLSLAGQLAIRDATGRCVLTVPYAEAVTLVA